METIWTEDRIADLRKYAALGLSGNQIAGALGNGISRAAVIGKMFRPGIPNLNPSGSSTLRGTRNDSNIGRRVRVSRKKNFGYVPMQKNDAQIELDLSPEIFTVPESQRKTLMELEPGDCRYPFGDPGTPEFYFCGGDSIVDSPYCAFHHRLCRQPVRSPSIAPRKAA